MPGRVAACVALIAFAVCLVAGGIAAGNTFATTIQRALLAMAGMYVIGLVIGLVAQKMLEDNLRAEEEKLRNSAKLEKNDR